MARAQKSLPPPSGPFGALFAALASPWMRFALGLAVAAGAVYGLIAPPGQHPAESLALQLPAALLPFCLAATAMERTGRARVLTASAAGALALALLGGAVAGDAPGVAEVGSARPTESYTRALDGREIEAHLQGQLTAALTPTGAGLRLGTREHVIGETVLPLDGAGEAALGPWGVYLRSVEPGDEPALARLEATPRAGGEPVRLTLRNGSGAELPDGTRIAALRLSGDFGEALGPAAHLQIDWDGGSETAWFFVESPDLDARTGDSPWKITLREVDAEPHLTLGVRRRGASGLALAGLGLLALALLAMAALERRS